MSMEKHFVPPTPFTISEGQDRFRLSLTLALPDAL